MHCSRRVKVALFGVLVAGSAPLMAAPIFSENFDDGNAASRWTTVSTSADTGAVYNFDYSSVVDYNGASIGVPQAGQTSHTGLQMWANRSNAAVAGVNAFANNLNLTGSVQMTFDMYAHFTDAGGSTIYGTYGFYHTTTDGTWNSLGTPATSGYWFTTSSDNGTSTAYRALKAGSNLGTAANYLGGSQNGATAGYQALFPDQDDAGSNSVAGFILNRWVNVRMTRNTDTGEIKLEMKNPADGAYTQIYDFIDTAQTTPGGTITLGMTDPFSSLSGPGTYYLFDNVAVTALPEPASLSLIGAAGLLLAQRRRRRSV
jgi:hypothetical protein